MTTPSRIFSYLTAALLGGVLFAAPHDDLAANFSTQESALQAGRDKAQKTLNSRFLASLQKAEQRAQQAGDLAALTDIRPLKEAIIHQKDLPASRHPSVARMQKSFDKQAQAIQQDHQARLGKLNTSFLKALQQRAAALVAADKLDDALAVDEAIAAHQKHMAAAADKNSNQEHFDLLPASPTKEVAQTALYWPPIAPSATDESGQPRFAGVLIEVNGTSWLTTSESSLYGHLPGSLRDIHGNQVDIVRIEVNRKHDLARLGVRRQSPSPLYAWPIASGNPAHEAPVDLHRFGFEGSPSPTASGTVLGVGPDALEVSVSFTQRDIGFPLLNKQKQVVGIASHATEGSGSEWVTKGTRFNKVRYYGVRVDHADHWMPVAAGPYIKASSLLGDQAIATLELVEFLHSLRLYAFRIGQGGSNEKIYPVALLSSEYPVEERKRLYSKPAYAVEMNKLYKMVASNPITARSSETEVRSNYFNLRRGIANRAETIAQSLKSHRWPTPQLTKEAAYLREAMLYLRDHVDKALEPRKE